MSSASLPAPADIESQLHSEDVQVVCDALVSLTFHHAALPGLEAHVQRLLEHPHPQVRRTAAICQGYTFGPLLGEAKK
jgi:hypothetical protein